VTSHSPSCTCMEDCPHVIDAPDQDCHRSLLFPCPGHFAELTSFATHVALPDPRHGGAAAFLHITKHLAADGYLSGAWYTWAAMIHGATPADDADRRAQSLAIPAIPDDAPGYVYEALPLVSIAVRAAIAGDGLNLQAALEAAGEQLTAEAMLSFLMSMAGTARTHTDSGDSFMPKALSAYYLLGSQVGVGQAAVMLPDLVRLTVAQTCDGDPDDGRRALKRLLAREDPGTRNIPAAIDTVSRTLGQLLTENPTIMTRETGGEMPDLILDIATATADNTDRGVMAGVWAVRSAQAYTGADNLQEATGRVQQLVSGHDDPTEFAIDVLVGGTQMLAYLIDTSDHVHPS
jgi:hypothetical protein